MSVRRESRPRHDRSYFVRDMPGLLIVAWPVIAETPIGTDRDSGNDDQECNAHQSCGRCGYGRKGGKDGQLARCVVHGEYFHVGTTDAEGVKTCG